LSFEKSKYSNISALPKRVFRSFIGFSNQICLIHLDYFGFAEEEKKKKKKRTNFFFYFKKKTQVQDETASRRTSITQKKKISYC
jgi:hypothetical protein